MRATLPAAVLGCSLALVSSGQRTSFDAFPLYQVDATMPGGITKAQFHLMMQNLLTERFRPQIHRETRSFPVMSWS